VLCPKCGAENSGSPRACRTCKTVLSAREVERRHLTVFFCDLVGSTALSQELDPEELSDLIREYQGACAAAVERFGGYIAQYLGDGILVYFGFPEAHGDDARRAICAGLETVRRVSALTMGSRTLRCRIGIHTGLVVIGTTGPGHDGQPLAFGEAPNLAARVQAKAEPDQVLVTETTRRLASGYFFFSPAEEKVLSGVLSTRLYVANGETAAQTRLDAARESGLTPFVGREEETATLLDFWQEAQNHAGRVVILRGEPGVGKSRLIEVFKQHVALGDGIVLQGHCSPLHRNASLHPITALARQWVGETGSATPADLSARLAAKTSALGLSRLHVFALSALLSLPPDPATATATANISPQRQRRLILEATVEWLRRLATQTPVLAVIEDLHWADPTSLEVLETWVRNSPARTLVALTTWPEFQAEWVGQANVAEIRLAPLGPREVTEMVTAVAGKKHGESLAAKVYEMTDGLPLFVEEVTRAMLELGTLAPPVDPRSPAKSQSSAVPVTLQDWLTARLDRLGTAKGTAQIASVIGREFSSDLLSGVSAVPEEALRPDLDRLLASGLLFSSNQPPTTYVFKHALVRDAAYASLSRAKRREFHQRIARVLSDRFPDLAASRPELVGTHLEEAGDVGNAAAQWQRAGVQALGRSANREAIAHLKRALRLTELTPISQQRSAAELALNLAIAPAFMAINGWAAHEVEDSCRRALQLAEELGAKENVLPALWGLWSTYFVRGRIPQALTVAERVLALAHASGSPLFGLMARHAMVFTLFYLGRLSEALRHAEDAARLFSRDQEWALVGIIQTSSTTVIRGIQAICLALQDRHDESARAFEQGRALASDLGHPPSTAIHLSLAAELYYWQHDTTRLLETAERLLELAEFEGFQIYVGAAHCYRGWARGRLGDLSGGRADIETGLREYERCGAQLSCVHARWGLADLLARSSLPLEALGVLEDAFRDADLRGERNCDAELGLLRGVVLIQANGAIAEATGQIRKAAALARDQGAHLLERRATSVLAALEAGGADSGRISSLDVVSFDRQEQANTLEASARGDN
jgi:class 3 adenylate cyclase/tetratricopeptide (TPR) repeat protein